MAPVAKPIPTASPAFPKVNGNCGCSRFNYEVPLEDRHGARPQRPPNQRAVTSCFQNLFSASTAARTDEVIEYHGAMSAFGGIADLVGRHFHVRF